MQMMGARKPVGETLRCMFFALARALPLWDDFAARMQFY
jgi:hypothetical protein